MRPPYPSFISRPDCQPRQGRPGKLNVLATSQKRPLQPSHPSPPFLPPRSLHIPRFHTSPPLYMAQWHFFTLQGACPRALATLQARGLEPLCIQFLRYLLRLPLQFRHAL